MAEITPLQILDIIHQALLAFPDSPLMDVTFECDNDSGEIIMTYCDGDKFTDWVLRSRNIERAFTG